MIGGVKGKEELHGMYIKKIYQKMKSYCQGGDNKLLMNEGLYVEDINYINDIEYKYPIKCRFK